MLESLVFYAFILGIAYVVYWSVARDPGPKVTGEKRKFTPHKFGEKNREEYSGPDQPEE